MNIEFKSRSLVGAALAAGILLLVVFIIFNFYEIIGVVFKTDLFASRTPLRILAIIYFFCSCFFYFGFMDIGKRQTKSWLIWTSALWIPLMLLLILTQYPFFTVAPYLRKTVVVFLGINGIFFGLALFNLKNIHPYAGDVGGIMQIVYGLIFIIPFIQLQLAGIVFLFMALFFQCMILQKEYKRLSTT